MFDGKIENTRRPADGPRADLRKPDTPQGPEGEPQATSLLTQEALRIHPDIVEMQRRMCGSAQAHHRLIGADTETLQAAVDNEGRNAVATRLRIGCGGDMKKSEWCASEMKCFPPLRIQPSPSRRAVVRTAAASDPASGP